MMMHAHRGFQYRDNFENKSTTNMHETAHFPAKNALCAFTIFRSPPAMQ
jgi:hypothetical protein